MLVVGPVGVVVALVVGVVVPVVDEPVVAELVVGGGLVAVPVELEVEVLGVCAAAGFLACLVTVAEWPVLTGLSTGAAVLEPVVAAAGLWWRWWPWTAVMPGTRWSAAGADGEPTAIPTATPARAETISEARIETRGETR